MAPRRKSIAITQNDWGKVKSNLQCTANKIFQQFFAKYPNILETQFINLRDVPRNQLIGVSPENLHSRAKAHALVVVNKITEIVDKLNDESAVTKEMYQLGRDHANRPLTEESLQAMKNVMVDVLQGALHFGDENRAAWEYEVNQVVSKMWEAIVERRKSIENAKSEWARANHQQIANKIFNNLFKKYPAVLEGEFINLAGVPRSQLVEVGPNDMHPKAKAHALVVVEKITNIVNHLGNDQQVSKEMVELGTNHTKRPLTKQGLDAMKTVMVDVLQEELGFGSEGRDAWDYEISTVINKMWEAINTARH